jgi:cardiolipin synthase A/B
MSTEKRREQQGQSSERLDRALARVSGATLREGNQITLLKDGPETYEDWLRAIGSARHWVHLENYIFKDGTIGRRFADALIERAAAGVRVRVLYDWFGSLDVPRSFWRRMREGGVDVRPFNPPTVGAPLDVIQRDHRKSLVVDGSYGSVGGVCIADEWLIRSPETGLPYRDTAARVYGPVVADLERAFAAVWNRAGQALPADEQVVLDDYAAAGDIEARVVVQEPGRLRMLRMLEVVTAGVEQRLWIADAYFLASAILREALMASARDGVDVRILLPSSNDLVVVGALSRYGYRPLLEAGVKIFEYSGPMMHAKTTVADGWWSRIGSTNLNVTGLVTNWEIDLVVEDRRFGATMEAMFEHDLGEAREIRLSGRRVARAPVRRRSRAERKATGRVRGSGTGLAVARVGQAAMQAASGDWLRRHERTVGAVIGAGVLGTSLIAARFPRAIVWPLAAVGAAFGGISIVRAVRGGDPDGTARLPRLPRLRQQRPRLRRPPRLRSKVGRR